MPIPGARKDAVDDVQSDRLLPSLTDCLYPETILRDKEVRTDDMLCASRSTVLTEPILRYSDFSQFS
jgi:hypothetical protein